MSANALKVDGLRALEHGQMHGVMGGLVEILQERQRRLAEIAFDPNALAELEQPQPQAVAVGRTFERPLLHERFHETVSCCLGQVRVGSQYAERELGGSVALEGTEEIERLAYAADAVTHRSHLRVRRCRTQMMTVGRQCFILGKWQTT